MTHPQSNQTSRSLVAGCEGKDFVTCHDFAITRLFLDTGMLLAEMAGLPIDDLDLDLASRSCSPADAPRRAPTE
jgi:site-specific recombinase XerC